MQQTGLKISAAVSVLLVALLATVNAAHALDYVSVADSSAILYDANSTRAKKLFVISRYTPLEQVVSLKDWIKVRDRSGTMAWIERRAVTDKRYVVVTAQLATVWKIPEPSSPVLFQVSQNVAMESLGVNGGGWIRVRDLDGTVGYMKSIEVWGAE